MRRALFAVLLVLVGLCRADAWVHGSATNTNTCPQGTGFADGCSAAPSGTPQFANLLTTGVVINAGLAGVGSGYTNGTGYAWSLTCSTINAAGTVDVVGGSLANVQITNRGSGCTAGARNITTPAGAGGGTGGQVQASVIGFRPAWNVAGVDYAVGPQATPTLDPATISATGVTVNTTSCQITIAASVTLSGYDFTKTTCNSGAGGWFISITGGSAVTITNCKAQAPPTAVTPLGFLTISGSGGTYVLSYCSLDGNVANQTGSSDGYLIKSTQSSGTVTVEYCLCTNAYGDMSVTGEFAALTIEFSVLKNSKFNTGSHGEYVNAATGTSNSVYSFNMTIQDYADSTGFPGELSSVWENSASDSSYSISGLNYSNNATFLFGTAGHTATGLPDSHPATSVYADLHTIPSGTSTNGSPTVQNNYVMVSGILDTVPGVGFLNCDSSVVTPSVSGNVNMETGATITGLTPCN